MNVALAQLGVKVPKSLLNWGSICGRLLSVTSTSQGQLLKLHYHLELESLTVRVSVYVCKRARACLCQVFTRTGSRWKR